MDRQKWADRQVKALIDAGVNPLDAELSAQWVLDTAPADADLDTWIPTVLQIAENPDDPALVQDARVDWYAKEETPAKFKRLLDAKEVE